MTLKELGLDHVDGYHITDLYDDYDYGIVTPDRRFKVDVNPSGSELKKKRRFWGSSTGGRNNHILDLAKLLKR